jgi:hypothetical protein
VGFLASSSAKMGRGFMHRQSRITTHRSLRGTNPSLVCLGRPRQPSKVTSKVSLLCELQSCFHRFGLSVGVLDAVQSIRFGPALRVCGETWRRATRLCCLARLEDQKDAPAWDTNESSTVALPNGEGVLKPFLCVLRAC